VRVKRRVGSCKRLFRGFVDSAVVSAAFASNHAAPQ